MNERIKQLAEQARKNEPFECSYTKDQWLEKFAKLIIQECADIATINAHQYQPPGDFVLEHFGVEE